jgi:undecaprenyl-diphosphatase
MLEKLLELDHDVFTFLNSLGSEQYDPFWLYITQQIHWIPFFLLLFYLIYKKIGGKQTLYLLFFVALLIAFTDQLTNVFKNGFERLRPCNNPNLGATIRKVLIRDSFSFFSGHAANTSAVATLLYLVMKKHYKYFWLIFFWPLVFAYSRIYLGLHFPSDILFGYMMGALTGFGCYKLYRLAQQKYFSI